MQGLELQEKSQERAKRDPSRLVIAGGVYPKNMGLLGSRSWALRISLLVLVFIYLYAPVFGRLAETWWTRDNYSHGFLVPLISLYLVWYRRERLRPLHLQPAFLWGNLVVITAGMMFLLGEAGGVITLQELSIVAMIAGLVLCLLGKEYLKALGFPIAYLLFMIPIADEILNPFHWTFQLLTAKMGVAFLQTMGFTALLEHQYIVLPNITLEVAQACSGISYLISIIAIGIPLAYVTQKNAWCRVILVVSAVIIGVVANWVRVAAIGIWAYYGGQVLHGPFHVFQALFVAQIGFIALFAGAWILAKVPGPVSKSVHFSPVKVLSRKQDMENPNRLLNRSWLGGFVILIGLASYLSFYNRGPIPLKIQLELFPISIGDWRGEGDDVRKAVFRAKGADHELMRMYRSPSGHEIQVYVAYYESQHHTKELVNDLTARLHRSATLVEIPINQQGSISINQSRTKSDRGDRRIYFWYDLNGRVVADQYKAKFVTTLDALIHRRTNGAFVLVAGSPIGLEKDENMKGEEQILIWELMLLLNGYLP